MYWLGQQAVIALWLGLRSGGCLGGCAGPCFKANRRLSKTFDVIILLLFSVISSNGWCQLGQNLMIDTKALSLGHAVTADPVGVNDVHFNPAGLATLNGRHFGLSMLNTILESDAQFQLADDYRSTGLVDASEDPVAGKTGHARAAAYVPGLGISPIDAPILSLPSAGIAIEHSQWPVVFASTVYAPMAAGFARDNDDPGRYQGKKVAMQRLTYLSPTVAYQLTPTLSMGVGFLISHQALALEQDVRSPHMLMGVMQELQAAFGCEAQGGGADPLNPFLALCGGLVGPYRDVGSIKMDLSESASPSYNIGLLWQPNDWLSLGMVYQSGAKSKLVGEFEFSYEREFYEYFRKLRSSVFGAIGSEILQLPAGASRETGQVSLDFHFPQHAQFGLSIRPLTWLKVNIDAGWTDYSEWDEWVIEFDRPLDFLKAARYLSPEEVDVDNSRLVFPLKYRSVWSYSLGVTVDVNDRWQVRFGYEPRETSIPDNRRSILAPLGFSNLYAFGIGYQWSPYTHFDFALSFMESKEQVNANESKALNDDCFTCAAHNPYPNMDVKTKLSLYTLGISFRTEF
jgi:long-subunit fatty acid transport protein